VTSTRAGTITAGGTAYKVNLATWRPQPYQVTTRLVWPTAQDIPGAEGKVAGDPYIRMWNIDEWANGEGEDLWQEGFYNKSTNVSPKRIGDGLVLGAFLDTTNDDNGTPVDFVEGKRFGFAQGKLWAVANATVHEWQPSTDNWDETGTATGSSDTPTCVIDQGNGTNILVGYHTTHAVRQVAPGGANAAVTGLTFAYAPVLRNWGGTLFWLDGDDLYSFTMSGVAATETLVADVTGRSNDYLVNGYQPWNRMSLSDKGPIWYQRTDSGETFIHEYNVSTSTWRVLAKLPVDFATPYSIYFSHGFYFVGFRYADRHAASGDAYIYVFRSAQRFVAGPVRSTTGTTASKPVLIAGVIGDDLCFFYDGAYWAYNLTSGGIYQIADTAGTNSATVQEAVTFGQSIFLSNLSDALKVERANRLLYSTRTATLDSGRFDFGYQGISKALLSVTVVTDPLPALTSVNLSYSLDGASFVAVTGAHDTDDATSKTWTISTSSSSVVGEDFELRLTLASTSSAATPTVRAVTARAIGVERQRVWRLETDSVTFIGGVEGAAPRSADALSDLAAIATYNGVVALSNPWDGEEYDAPVSTDCVITAVGVGESDPHIADGAGFSVVELREVVHV